MQGCDLLTPLDVMETIGPSLPRAEPEGEELPLRYDVESMQHWMDLNA